MSRKEIKSNMAHAMYAYATKCQEATWENKRPGIKLPPVSARVKNCGAFRAWEILLARGRLCVCTDGYRTREAVYNKHEATCSVGVLVGDGEFVFPYDDSRTHHSLSMQCSGGKIVYVTDDESVPWEKELIELTNELNAAADEIDKAVAEYDAVKNAQREATRQAESHEARRALLASK